MKQIKKYLEAIAAAVGDKKDSPWMQGFREGQKVLALDIIDRIKEEEFRLLSRRLSIPLLSLSLPISGTEGKMIYCCISSTLWEELAHQRHLMMDVPYDAQMTNSEGVTPFFSVTLVDVEQGGHWHESRLCFERNT